MTKLYTVKLSLETICFSFRIQVVRCCNYKCYWLYIPLLKLTFYLYSNRTNGLV